VTTPSVVPPATPPVSPTTSAPPTPTTPPGQPAPVASSPPPAKPKFFRRPWLAGLFGLLILALFLIYWLGYRHTHSITEDAFVEADIVNIAPQSVQGHLVRFLVEENDRVVQGQVLAQIDQVPFRDEVELARSRVDAAEAELKRQQAGLDRLRLEVPIQIEIAKRTLAAGKADELRAQDALKLTGDQVVHGIAEAQAGLEAATADLVLAQQEYVRFTELQKEEAVPLRRAQEVTQARDAAEAHRKLAATKLANAESDKIQVDVARRSLEAAEKSTQRAEKGVELAETGNAQIREAELLTVVKKQAVAEARRALDLAKDELKYTEIRAPFPGVVVKLYRHLGDFASAGVPILSMYNTDLLYVTANLEETRLHGVAPGNPVELHVDAFAAPFRGRVLWLNKSTGAQFALMPRNVVSGEFTKVVQRVPVRIAFEKDDRWPLLRAGLSVQAVIGHGDGDAQWAEQAARDMADIQGRYNQAQE
jgi:membrane fusion protein (multidrug efflux system)